MRHALMLIVALLAVTPALADEASYSIQLHYDSGSFSLQNILLADATPMPASGGNEYAVRVVSFLGSFIYETTFTPQLFVFDSKGSPELTSTSVDLLLPWKPNAKEIQIWRNDSLIFTIDISSYANCNENRACDKNETMKFCPEDCTCGNGICEEDYASCKRDCSGLPDSICDEEEDGKCDPDCTPEKDKDCPQQTENETTVSVVPVVQNQDKTKISWYLIAVPAIAGIALIAFFGLRSMAARDSKKK